MAVALGLAPGGHGRRFAHAFRRYQICRGALRNQIVFDAQGTRRTQLLVIRIRTQAIGMACDCDGRHRFPGFHLGNEVVDFGARGGQ